MTFKEKLSDALCCLGITQSQLAKMTGYSKSSISQYLSGKNIPSEDRQKEIAVILGLEEDYFQQEIYTMNPAKRSNKIPTLTPQQAGELLGMSKETVRAGLRDGVFPWGYAIHGTGDRWIYFINANRFAEIEGVKLA